MEALALNSLIKGAVFLNYLVPLNQRPNSLLLHAYPMPVILFKRISRKQWLSQKSQ